MAKEKKSQRAEFKGHIEHISVSPHGDPEGIVLEDGTFIKIPPHSLVAKDEIRKGGSFRDRANEWTKMEIEHSIESN